MSERVAVILHEPLLGGATYSLLRVLDLLESRGWEFSFWVPGRGAAEAELRRRGYEVAGTERLLRFSASGLREAPGPARRLAGLPAYLRSVRAWVRAQRADVVHANTLLTLPELAGLPRSAPPAVLHVHEAVPAGLKGLVTRAMIRRADVVVAVSESTAAQLRGRRREALVVYNGVDLPLAHPAPRTNRGPVVGTIGTICRRKGSDLFVAMSGHLRSEREAIEFRLVGDLVVGGERPWAERILEAALAEQIVHRSGVDPYAEMADWDVFVMPSRTDPCPLAVLEAMAMGVPVVGSRVGGIPEEVGADAGLLVDPEDVPALSSAVLRLIDQPELRAALGEAGRGRVERLFTLERQADGLDRAYRTAVTRSSRG